MVGFKKMELKCRNITSTFPPIGVYGKWVGWAIRNRMVDEADKVSLTSSNQCLSYICLYRLDVGL